MPTQKTQAAVFAAIWLLSCGDDTHPPFADDAPGPGGAESMDPGGESLIGDDEEDTIGSCGLVDVEVEVLRPNFYFVLDSSDSMSELMPNSGGGSRHLAARRAIVDMLRVSGHRVNFAVNVFPDPDGDDGCSAGRTVFPLRPGEPLLDDGSDSASLDALEFNLRKYSPSGATPVGPTLELLHEELQDLPTATRLFLLTDGAPNCGPEGASCETDRCIPNIEGAHFQGAPRCDEEFNCCEELFPHLCLDADGVFERLAGLAAAGIDTYVIGIPGSEAYADVLAEMARAAGTARREAPSEYYPVADAEELATTLTSLGQQLSASCEFDLGSAPRDVDSVRVALDERDLPLDSPDGFRWTGRRSIEILGGACEDWRSGEVATLRVFERCFEEAR